MKAGVLGCPRSWVSLMLRWPDTTYAMPATTAANGLMPAPKASAPRATAASGVLAAPARTPTMPNAAAKAGSKPSTPESADPAAAPITNTGVMAPPLKPEPSVTATNAIFRRKADQCIRSPSNARSYISTPSPR